MQKFPFNRLKPYLDLKSLRPLQKHAAGFAKKAALRKNSSFSFKYGDKYKNPTRMYSSFFSKKSRPVKCRLKCNELGQPVPQTYLADKPTPVDTKTWSKDFTVIYEELSNKLRYKEPRTVGGKTVITECQKAQSTNCRNALTKYFSLQKEDDGIIRTCEIDECKDLKYKCYKGEDCSLRDPGHLGCLKFQSRGAKTALDPKRKYVRSFYDDRLTKGVAARREEKGAQSEKKMTFKRHEPGECESKMKGAKNSAARRKVNDEFLSALASLGIDAGALRRDDAKKPAKSKRRRATATARAPPLDDPCRILAANFTSEDHEPGVARRASACRAASGSRLSVEFGSSPTMGRRFSDGATGGVATGPCRAPAKSGGKAAKKGKRLKADDKKSRQGGGKKPTTQSGVKSAPAKKLNATLSPHSNIFTMEAMANFSVKDATARRRQARACHSGREDAHEPGAVDCAERAPTRDSAMTSGDLRAGVARPRADNATAINRRNLDECRERASRRGPKKCEPIDDDD